MPYKVKLKASDGFHDEREATTDEQLFTWLGYFSIWYYLALETVDYQDANWTNWGAEDGSDRLLAFTALKETDTLDGPHRHGMPTGILARGNCWIGGQKLKCTIEVEKA